MLARNLLVFEERHFIFAKLENRIACHRIDTGNDGGDNFLFLVLILAHHAVAFGLANALDNDLLCGLCRNAAEILRLDLDFDDVADIIGLFDFTRLFKRDFGFIVKAVLAADNGRLCAAVIVVKHIAVGRGIVDFD